MPVLPPPTDPADLLYQAATAASADVRETRAPAARYQPGGAASNAEKAVYQAAYGLLALTRMRRRQYPDDGDHPGRNLISWLIALSEP